tara:strand:- start:189 stop:851 length:663 start_codon:yes stop_codon:yes gene_type:complete
MIYGIFDIDSIVYASCYNSEDFEEVTDSFWSKYKDIVYNMEMRYGEVKMINVGFCTNNYRKKVDSSYKGNRTQDKPEHLGELIEYVKENLDVEIRSGIETDDLVAKFLEYYGKDKSVIISIDKDYMQFECTIYSYNKREFITVSKEEALYNLWEQMVIGDRADNVLVCKGYGVKWCEKTFKGKNRFGMMKDVLTLYKKVYKGKGREKLIRTYLLLKLNVF